MHNVEIQALPSSMRRRSRRGRASFALLATACTAALGASTAVKAQSLNWNGGTTNVWDFSTADWLSGATPTAYTDGSSVTFGSIAATSGTVTLNITVNPAQVVFNGTNNYSLAGTGLMAGTTSLTQMGSGILTLKNTGTDTFTGGTLISAGTINVGGGNNAGDLGTGNVTNNANLIFQRGSTIDVVANNISGTGNVTVNGTSSKVTFSGDNSNFLGQLLVTNGITVTIGSNTGAGASNGVGVVLAAATGNGDMLAVNSNLTINTPLTMFTAGALGAPSGRSTLLAPVANTAGSTWAGNISMSGSNYFVFNASATNVTTALTISGNVTGTNSTMLIRGAGNGVISGTINNAGGTLFHTDAGTWTISGANNTLANMQVLFGLRSGANNAFGSNTAISFGQSGNANSGNVDLAGFNQQFSSVTIATGATTPDLSNNRIFNSTTNLSTLTINATADDLIPIALNGNLQLIIAGTATVTLANNGTAFATTYSGGTVVNAGTLTASGSAALGATTGSLAVNNTNTTLPGTTTVLNLSTTVPTTTGSLSGTISVPTSGINAATINNGGQTFTVNQTTPGTFAGVIAGNGGFTLGSASTQILAFTGANTYAGGTTINAGVLSVSSDANLGAATGAVNVGAGTLLSTGSFTTGRTINLTDNTASTLDATGGNTFVLTSTVTATGAINKGSGLGTVQLAQNGFAATSDVNVQGGTLAFGTASNGVTGPVNIPGTLSVSDGAIASFIPATGTAITHTITNLNLNTAGKLDVGNSSFLTNSNVQPYLAAGYNNGAWNGSGAAIISTSANTAPGTAARSLGFASDADQAAGRVAAGNPTLAAGQTLVKYTTPGDADLSGKSDFNDFLAMQNNFNKAGNWTQGDFDYNGTTNFNDFLILQNNFNRGLNANGTTAGGTVAHSAVSKLTASPAAVTPSVTYILSKNDDGKGNLTPGKYAVYAVDSSADGNQGVASFSVDVQGASLVTNFAPQGTFDKGQGNGSTVVEGFTLLRSVSGAFSTGTDPVKGSQDTVDDQSGVVLIYGMGQVAGNLNTKAPSGSTGGSGKVQASYGSPLLISTGTFASGLAFNSDQTFDKANVFLTNTAADTEAAGITLVTQDLSVGVPEPTTLGVIALGAGSLLGRRKRRSSSVQ